MLRVFGGSPRIATVLLCGLLVPLTARAQPELPLPAPRGESSVQAIALRAELSPRPDGAHDAVVSLTVLNPEADTQELLLVPGGYAPVVTRAGESARLQDDGSYKIRLEGAEVAVLRVRSRIQASQEAFLPAERAGWQGRARGPVLQPAQVLRIAHPAGSPWSDTALDVLVDPGGGLLAASLAATSGAVARADGSVSWRFAAGRAPAALELAWPAVETETVLPLDPAEAEVFGEYWTGRRGIEPGAVRRVRQGLLAAHGRPPESAEERRDFRPERRPGWAPLPGPPPPEVLEAAERLAELERRLEAAGEARVAAVTPPTAAPSTAPTPPAARPAQRPAETVAQESPEPRPAARPPSAPPARQERARRPEPRRAPAPDLSAADDDPLVTEAPDDSWRRENLLQTEASVPADPELARRWARRALRGGHGVSRAVLARESVPALHGKTWAPGYVAEFFRTKEWYSPRADFSMEDLSGDERAAYERLDELVQALQGGRALEPEQLLAQAEPPPARSPSPQPAGRAPREEPRPGTRSQAQAPGPEGETATPAAPTAPASTREAPRPASLGDVPWLQNPAQARIFLFREKAKGLDGARVRLAIATIEARHGKPFDGEPAYREHFEAQGWYRPQGDYGPERLSIPARESITLLRAALESRTW